MPGECCEHVAAYSDTSPICSPSLSGRIRRLSNRCCVQKPLIDFSSVNCTLQFLGVPQFTYMVYGCPLLLVGLILSLETPWFWYYASSWTITFSSSSSCWSSNTQEIVFLGKMLPNKLFIIFLSLASKSSHIYIPKILRSIISYHWLEFDPSTSTKLEIYNLKLDIKSQSILKPMD